MKAIRYSSKLTTDILPQIRASTIQDKQMIVISYKSSQEGHINYLWYTRYSARY